jgi:hypothetical protein
MTSFANPKGLNLINRMCNVRTQAPAQMPSLKGLNIGLDREENNLYLNVKPIYGVLFGNKDQ